MTVEPAPVPRTFWQYLRSFGPGIIVVLTWLGAGDIVGSGVAGGNYGYALMWMMVLALVMRYLFVSLVVKYQLCNQHGESVVDGLVRLHRLYAPFLVISGVVMGHVYGAYMLSGCGVNSAKLAGVGEAWQWSLLWSVAALALIFQPIYRRVELVFKVFLAILAVSLIGTALWAGPSPLGILRGTFTFALPERKGAYDSLLVAVAILGTAGGSLMNLAYPYLMEQKGWRGPLYRRVQMYDFMLAITVMIILNLAVWTLGAELIFRSGRSVKDIDGLSELLGLVLGESGTQLFFLGVFAAVFTSLVGNSLVVACLASHGYLRWRRPADTSNTDYTGTWVYRGVAVWSVVSPLIWTLPGMPDFVTLTLVGNGLQVLLVPFLAGGLWCITAQARFIGPSYRNSWWENLVMCFMFVLALGGAYGMLRSLFTSINM